MSKYARLNKRKKSNAPLDINYFFDRSIPEPNSGCWIWMGATQNGYGAINDEHKTKRAHRVVYSIVNGCIVDRNLDVCHRCDVRQCVNPSHLFVGTRSDNMSDCASKGRIRTPKLEGVNSPNSKLTAEQVLAIRSSTLSQRALGRKYKVDKGTISAIQKRKTWRSI